MLTCQYVTSIITKLRMRFFVVQASHLCIQTSTGNECHIHHSKETPCVTNPCFTESTQLFSEDGKNPTCTMVSRFCRDVEAVFITEAGPMVTTVAW